MTSIRSSEIHPRGGFHCVDIIPESAIDSAVERTLNHREMSKFDSLADLVLEEQGGPKTHRIHKNAS
jgi:hypothetical protein